MRILSLVVLFTAAFYYFIPEQTVGEEVDILKVQISAPERVISQEEPRLLTETRREAPPEPPSLPATEEINRPAADVYYQDQDPGQVSETTEVEHYAEEDEAQINEIEAGWNHELRESLTMMEPEFAEEIYHAYENERGAYQADLDFLVKEHQKNMDLELMINDLELRHEERLKEIFGRHYEEIKALQSSYIEYRASSN